VVNRSAGALRLKSNFYKTRDGSSTSHVERQNWTVRTTMRRYTRLSNGFSRKIENHIAAVALNYFAYNFIKIHNDAPHVSRDGRWRH